MLDVIRARKSVRTYAGRDLEPDLLSKVEAVLAQQGEGHFGHRPRFALIHKATANRQEKVKLGTYGFIKGPRYFIAGAVAKAEMAEVDYGYALENVILEMTRLGLGTCWIGGTLSRKEYVRVLKATPEEFIPAVTPVGYAEKRRGTVDRLVRWGAKADKRLPRDKLFFDGSFDVPLLPEAAGRYADVLEMVRIGPSASNRQPWRILRDGSLFHLYLVRTPGYRKTVPSTDLQMLDMGIAMCHFEVAAKALGLPGCWLKDAPELDVPESCEFIASWSAD